MAIAKTGVDQMLGRSFNVSINSPADPNADEAKEYENGIRFLTEYHEATGDPRVMSWLKGYFNYNKQTIATTTLNGNCCSQGNRVAEHLGGLYWLYNRVGDSVAVAQIGANFKANVDEITTGWMNFPSQLIPHGVDLDQQIKYPALYSQQFPDVKYRNAVLTGLTRLDSLFGQVGGRFAAHERLPSIAIGRQPTDGTELCGVSEFAYSMERLFEIWGDVSFADRLELLVFNSIPGAMTADMWAHQYDQQANQVLADVSQRVFDNGPYANCYGLAPNFQCCLSNLPQGWPRYVENMWMATQDNGLIAAAYGPSVVHAKVGSGDSVSIIETTNYPFDGRVTIRVTSTKSLAFPIHFRIPQWARGTKYGIGNGAGMDVAAGTVGVVNRTWANNDSLVIAFPMTIRTESRYNKAVAILRGPVYYSLRISPTYTSYGGPRGIYPSSDWTIKSSTPWNYGMVIDTLNPAATIVAQVNPIGLVPFAQKNEQVFRKTAPDPNPQWQAVAWQDPEPVILKAKAKVIPSWSGLVLNSAPNPPASPFVQSGPVVDVELIPYGSARMRICEFPRIDTVPGKVQATLQSSGPADQMPTVSLERHGRLAAISVAGVVDKGQLAVYRMDGARLAAVTLHRGLTSVSIAQGAGNACVVTVSTPRHRWVLRAVVVDK
jgi:hypothetical protein